VNGPKSYAYRSDCDVSELPLPAAITASPDGIVQLDVHVGKPTFVTPHARERVSAPLCQIRLLPAVNELLCSLLLLHATAALPHVVLGQ
jgi:hypothetical protein